MSLKMLEREKTSEKNSVSFRTGLIIFLVTVIVILSLILGIFILNHNVNKYKKEAEKAKAEGTSNIASASGTTASTSSTSGTQGSTLQQAAEAVGGEFDFDSFESDVDSMLEASMQSTGVNM